MSATPPLSGDKPTFGGRIENDATDPCRTLCRKSSLLRVIGYALPCTGAPGMRRREFVKTIAGSAFAWPLRAHGQQRVPVVGVLAVSSESALAMRLVALRQGLAGEGYKEGQNLTIWSFAPRAWSRMQAPAPARST